MEFQTKFHVTIRSHLLYTDKSDVHWAEHRNTGLLKMIFGDLTTCHTQYT